MSQNTIVIPEEATIEDLLNGAIDCLGEAACAAEDLISLSYAREINKLRNNILVVLDREFS